MRASCLHAALGKRRAARRARFALAAAERAMRKRHAPPSRSALG
jgi:hypothetical protein